MRSLLQDVSLTFTRYEPETEDEFYRTVEGATTTFEATGSLQPFRRGTLTTTLPEGRKAEDALVFYSNVPLKSADPYESTPPDKTTINGREFEVFDVGDWSTTTIITNLSHYKTILLGVEEGG
jgi:hypothetical protein